MKKLLFASTNKGKLREMREIASLFSCEIIDPADLVGTYGPVPQVEEGENSYRENATLKARAFFEWSSLPVVADDTGLEVNILQGAPGVISARYAGQSATMEENRTLLLQNLSGASDRSALFRCILCYIDGVHSPVYAEEVLHGSIDLSNSGEAGFGYDSLFVVGNTGKTLASLKESQKIRTHRHLAFDALFKAISHY